MSAPIVPEGTPVEPADIQPGDWITDPLLGEVGAVDGDRLYVGDGEDVGDVWDAPRARVRAAIRPTPKPVEPGPEVVALLDVDGDMWARDADGWAVRGGGSRHYGDVARVCGPVTFLVAQEPQP